MARVYYDEDATYLRSLEEERIELSGPTCEYFSLNRGQNVDALYGEPTNDPLYGGSSPPGTPSRSEDAWNFYPDAEAEIPEPDITFPCAMEFVESDGRTPSVREGGFVAEFDGIVSISRNHWECAYEGTTVEGRLPKEGDVIYVFDEWWDVVRSGTSGNVLDSTTYVGFRLEVKKRTQFTPDKKD